MTVTVLDIGHHILEEDGRVFAAEREEPAGAPP